MPGSCGGLKGVRPRGSGVKLAVSGPMGADPQPFLKPKRNMPFALADHLQGTEKEGILREF